MMSYAEKIKELEIEDEFSSHYHCGFSMAVGQAELIATEADARIQELEAELAHLRAVAEPVKDGKKPRHFPEVLEELSKMALLDPAAGKASEEIRYQMSLVNILADTAAYYRGSTVPQVKQMAASLYKAWDPMGDEMSLHDFMDQKGS